MLPLMFPLFHIHVHLAVARQYSSHHLLESQARWTSNLQYSLQSRIVTHSGHLQNVSRLTRSEVRHYVARDAKWLDVKFAAAIVEVH